MAERLDRLVAERYGLTRSRAEKLIRAGCVCVNGNVERKPGFAPPENALVSVDIPAPTALSTRPENLPLDILYEDEDMAVVNKPAGMVVHPAAGNESGTLVNALLYHLSGLSGIGGAIRPGIVHRLDKDTSGLLLVAKNDAAHLALSDALKERRIHKTYRAVVLGGFSQDDGVIEAPIARHPKDRKRMAVAPDGRYARTAYRVACRLHGASLLDIDLITGRTHQIRVHMASIGHPLLGDPIYGAPKARVTAERLMLHAWRLSLEHPLHGTPLSFEAPIPDAFARVVDRLS